jgi:hypothetical protein
MFAKHVVNIIMATAMISVFLGIFFFTYAAKVEQKIVVARSTQIVDDLIVTAKNNMNPTQKSVVETEIMPYLVVPESLEQADAEVAAANKELMKNAFKAIAVFVALCSILVGIIAFFFKVPLVDLIKDNLIILIFVGLTEFIFLTFFAQNYITIDSNYVKEKIIQTMITFGSQNSA